jgi:hypothetical protein
MRLTIKPNELVDRQYSSDGSQRVRIRRTISTAVSPMKDAKSGAWMTSREEVEPTWSHPFPRAAKA